MEEKTTNYTIAESYELPSKGLIYDTKIEPHVELRSMTTREEMRRLAPSNTPLKVLSEIIETCMITKPKVHVYDMCIGDYEYLLQKLRVVTHGPEYKIQIACPNCGSVHTETINLDDLKTITYNDDEVRALMDLTLPKSGNHITLKYQTPRIVDDIGLKIEQFNKKNKDSTINPNILFTLQSLIDTVDGQKLSYSGLEDFINKLPFADTNYILAKIEEVNKRIGLDNIIELVCGRCGGDVLTFFRYGPEFFRPTLD